MSARATKKKSTKETEPISREQEFLADPRERALVLRTCKADMSALHERANGFKWPTEGYVEAPDFSTIPKCGGGLHGLLHGIGDFSLLSDDQDAVWLAVEVIQEEVVSIDGQKVKFPRGWVKYSGNMAQAMAMVADQWIQYVLKVSKKDEGVEFTSVKSSSQASSGYFSSQASSGYSSSQASSGYSSSQASSGYSSRQASSGYSSRQASSGYSSRQASSGYSSSHEAKGAKSIVAAVGLDSQASAGEDGCIALAWWDEEAKRCRLSVGYVGENGIKANQRYKVSDKGEFIAC